MKKAAIVLVLSVFGVISTIPQLLWSEEKVDAGKLFERKCSICHTIERPKSKRKTKAEWTKTVTRMKNTNGCPISDEEAGSIIDYLAENFGPGQ